MKFRCDPTIPVADDFTWPHARADAGARIPNE